MKLSFNVITHLNKELLHLVYRRISVNNQHTKTFHSHRGTEILFIHQGKGKMIINNVSYDIRPGMLCIFQPYQLHHLTLEYSEGDAFERSLTIFEPSIYESYFTQWPALHAFYQYINSGLLHCPCIYEVEKHSELDLLFQNIENKMSEAAEAEQLEEASLFLVGLFRLLKDIWPQQQMQLNPHRSRKQLLIEQILEWIERHYTEPFQLEAMAQELHLSSYHLSHFFKETVGVSITEYITTRRTHQALILLTTTDKPIAWVAEQIGITNSSYFCKFFKERMGITPHQYRKKWYG